MIAVIMASFEKAAFSQLAHPEWVNVIFTQKADREPDSTETLSGAPTCPLQSPGGWGDDPLPRAAPLWWTTSWEAMMWICIIPWHLASLSTHYQCWVSGISECVRLCVRVCARGIKYPSLTFSLAVHVVQRGACQSPLAPHIFLVLVYLCVYLPPRVTVGIIHSLFF